MGNSCRMILKAVHLAQSRPDPVGEHGPVGRGTVVVRGRESVEVQPPAAPCCQDYRGRAHEHERPPLHVINDSADAGPVIVGEEFHDRTAVPSVDPGFEIRQPPAARA